MKLLTNLIFEPKGVHDPARTYSIKDTVMSPDGSKVYFALRDVPSGIALTDEYYWMLQIDLSSSKNAMDEAVAAFSDYAKIVGTRVKGETAKATGNPVSFLPDAGSLLQPVTVLEPQQSGSGDPYPAGGGKNLIPFPYMTSDKTENGVTFTVQDDGGIKVTGTAAGVAYFNLCEVHFSDINMSTAGTFTDGSVCLSGAAGGVNIGYSSGNNKTYLFTPSGGAIDTVVYPQVEKGSTPTEYQKHSNIRPFIGYDKVDMNHAGKNLLENTATSQTINGVTFTVNDDGSITANGTATDVVFFNVGRVLLENGVSYILSGCPAGGNNGGNFLMYVSIGSEFYYDFGSSVSFEGTGETRSVFIQVKSGATVNATFHPMIRPAFDTDATFQPYQGTLHTVQIGQTVYGGKFDWLTGKLTAEWAMEEVDGVNRKFSTVGYLGDGTCYCVYRVMTKPLTVEKGGSACSHLTQGSAAYGQFYISGGAADQFFMYFQHFASLDAANQYLAAQHAAGTPVQVMWKLATPIEIQLTPHIISAVELEQNNTLYGDGTIEVEYVKPLHVSIEERVAAALAAAAQTE